MKNLRKMREERNLSQQALGEYFCISQQSIHKYENGYAEPDIEMLIEFADFFHTSVDYLIGHTDNPAPNDFHPEENIPPKDLHHLYSSLQLSPAFKAAVDRLVEVCLKAGKS